MKTITQTRDFSKAENALAQLFIDAANLVDDVEIMVNLAPTGLHFGVSVGADCFGGECLYAGTSAHEAAVDLASCIDLSAFDVSELFQAAERYDMRQGIARGKAALAGRERAVAFS